MLYAGEILEHISNPMEFLSSIKRNYRNEIKRVVITVPNAFRLDNFRYAIILRKYCSCRRTIERLKDRVV